MIKFYFCGFAFKFIKLSMRIFPHKKDTESREMVMRSLCIFNPNEDLNKYFSSIRVSK